MNLYRLAARPWLFLADPEWIHDRSIRLAEWTGRHPRLCALLAARPARPDPRLMVEWGGLRFEHPIGLAAGYDTSGRAITALGKIGFSHLEIGSISADPSAGNPRPRLFRIIADRGIVVNYGLPNDGAERIAARLAQTPRSVPLGINLVNTNRGLNAPPESDDQILDDYLASAERLSPWADYFCLNLSCPNTREGRGFFSDVARLRRLLVRFDERGFGCPIILKVAPFPGMAELESFLEVAQAARCVTGFAVNLPPGKPGGLVTPAARLAAMPGAVSGRPCEPAINRTLAELYRRMDRRRYRLVAAGGVFSAEDAYRKIRLGASLVQLMTGLIYEGPALPGNIAAGLAQLLARDGFSQVREAVGVDARLS
jgi:dihydroorotate dehydrogenase (fumarate)/dihydroorotate dehydrogenase